MIGSKNVIFRNNPYVGIALSSPLKNKFVFDFGLNVRFNGNDDDFIFKAMGYNNLVNSKTSLTIDFKAGYKILDKKRMIIITGIGTGFESTGTGLSEEYETDDGEMLTKYHNLNIINFSANFTTYTPIFVKNYIGIAAGYHYCPYQWNKKLLTKFNNNSISCGLIFRF
jgi:hypothetical protein